MTTSNGGASETDPEVQEIVTTIQTQTKQELEIVRVATDDDMTLAAERVRRAKEMKSQAEDNLRPTIKKLHEAHKSMTGLLSRLISPIESFITTQSAEISRHIERKRIEERRIAAEQERKLREEAERQALAQAQALEQRAERLESGAVPEFTPGEAQVEAAELRDRAEAAISDVQAPNIVMMKSHAEKVAGVSTRIEYTWTLVDFNTLPPEYKMVNEVALNAAVRAQKSACAIPGIRVSVKTVSNVR